MKPIILFCAIWALSACTLNNQVKEIKRLGNCSYEIHSVDQVLLSGIDLREVLLNRKFDLASMPSLALGFLSRNIPLETSFILEIQNPNAGKAAIQQFDYQLFIDQFQLTEGTLNQQIEIPAQGSSLVPLTLSFNAYRFLADESMRQAIQEFFQAGNTGNEDVFEAKLLIKIKPGILIGNQLVSYPRFIDIEKNINPKLWKTSLLPAPID